MSAEVISVQVKTRGKLPAGMVLDEQRLQDALMAGAQRVADDLGDYYRIQDEWEPNRFVQEGTGSRRTHFWRQVSDSIRGPFLRGRSVRVEITDPRIKQKIYGGPIRAKNVRYLTIPIHPDAYALRAAELFSIVGKLFVVRKKDGRLFLAGKPEGKAIFYYRLKEEVNQKPWPTAAPKRRWIMESFRNGLRYFMRRA